MLQKHYSIKPHGSIITRDRKRVPHNFAKFDPLTQKFFHTETCEELFVHSSDLNKDDYAGWFILSNKETKIIFDGFLVIDHQNLCNLELILDQVCAQFKKHHASTVKIIQVYRDFWNGPFYQVQYDNKYWIPSINFNELRLTKVVKVPDGDFHFFYTKISPEYNPFGSPILFEIVGE